MCVFCQFRGCGDKLIYWLYFVRGNIIFYFLFVFKLWWNGGNGIISLIDIYIYIKGKYVNYGNVLFCGNKIEVLSEGR